jgi:nickel/cobalt transporter (NicO) family protein
MNFGPETLLIISVGVVGVLHTIVPDHWVPITLVARQRGWSKAETARAAVQAGIGHVVSTLIIASVIWLAGVAFAVRFGHFVDAVTSVALIAFGGWIAVAAWRDLHRAAGHAHNHGHGHGHSHDFSFLAGHAPGQVHGPELQRIDTGQGVVELSIYEAGVPPRFRLSGPSADWVKLETRREMGERQLFSFAMREGFWESLEEIPEPHGFEVVVTIEHDGHAHSYRARFAEHDHHGHNHGQGEDHDHDHEHGTAVAHDPLYAPMPGGVAVLARHKHAHRHGRGGSVHVHLHDHDAATAHPVTSELNASPPQHVHNHKTTARTALLLILGSSPMVEGIPAFFAAGRFGVGVIAAMALVFSASTIATYVVLCVYSSAGLQRLHFGAFERYGEVLSGVFISLVGVVFWLWPVL